MTAAPFAAWAILELMGHRVRPGYVEEVEIAGGKMLRVDIHGADGAVATEYYGVASVYSLRPVSEEIARDKGATIDVRPVRPVVYREREALPSPSADDADDEPEWLR